MATQETKQLRDFTLSVRLRADTRDRLELVADRLGVASATVASMAIGQYVAAQYAALTGAERQGETMAKAISDSLSEIFKNQLPESEKSCLSLSEPLELPQPSAVVPTKKPAKSFPPAQSFRSKRSTTGGLSK